MTMPNRSPTRPWRSRFLRLWTAVLVGASAVSWAGSDHDRARQATEAGEILPLRTILERVQRDYPGQVLDVELDRSDNHGPARWIYKIKLLQGGGALVKLKVDARTGAVISQKSKD